MISQNLLNFSYLELTLSNLEPYEDSYFSAVTANGSDEGILWKFNVTSLILQCVKYDTCRINTEVGYINNTSNVSKHEF